MQRKVTSIIAGIGFIFMPLISMATTSSSISHFAITWPTATPDSKTPTYNPILIYKCNSSKCDSLTSKDKILYVTSIPAQDQFGMTGTPPAPISFLDTEGKATTYKIFRASTVKIGTETNWGSCTLGLSSSGAIDQGNTTCKGAVATGNSTDSATALSFMAGDFTNQIETPPKGYENLLNNKIPLRTITFKNASPYSKICLTLNSKFVTNPGETCESIGGVVIDQKTPYTITISGKGAPAGKGGASMSGAAFVVGFYNNGAWHYTGNYKNTGLIYATAMEWSMLPTQPTSPTTPSGYTDHSIGVSTVDISAVNGFNLGVSLQTNNGAVCSTAARSSDGAAEPAQFYYYQGVFSELPTKGRILNDRCPAQTPFPHHTKTTQVVADKSGQVLGCLSPCKYATYLKSQNELPSYVNLAAVCCAAGTSYDNSQVCTAAQLQWGPSGTPPIQHDQLPYVQNLASPYTTQVYRWQFDDYKGTFSCDQKARFTFVIS